MRTVNVNNLPLQELKGETDPSLEARVAFPMFAATGSASSAVVYFEIEPGKRLGKHTDSAEEVLLVLEGEAEVMVGDERAHLSEGDLALVPAWVLHEVVNAGEGTLRVVGFFASATLAHAFHEPAISGSDTTLFITAGSESEIYAGTPLSLSPA